MTLKHLVATFWLWLTLCRPIKLVAQLRLASLPSCRLLSLALPSNAFTVRFFISAESFPRTLKNVSSVSPSFFFLMISRTCSKEECALSRNGRFCGANLPSPLMLISFSSSSSCSLVRCLNKIKCTFFKLTRVLKTSITSLEASLATNSLAFHTHQSDDNRRSESDETIQS